jgi:deazaflavin-dependent oxidoreductase (nitroreductase family)
MASRHSLPYVNPHVRRGPLYRLFVGILSTRFMTWLARTRPWGLVIWRIDPWLMRLTRGRLRTWLLLRTALLETRGARTGRLRRNAVVYFHDGERVTIIASQAGRPENPSWFYNARANPEVLLAGRPFRAEVVEDGVERARLWELADRVLPAFARYRDTAGRAGRTSRSSSSSPADRATALTRQLAPRQRPLLQCATRSGRRLIAR